MSDSNGARNVTTPRLGLNKPLVGGDLDIWGDFLNANCDTLDNSFLVTGGIFTGPVAGYPTSTPGAPAFSVGSGAGIYAMGASMGVSAFNSNVFTFSLSANMSAVPLNMNNNRILNVANPTVGTDAVNLNSLTNTLGSYLPLTGSPPSMLGPIGMGGNIITGLANPQNPTDATTKQYVDALIADMRLFVSTWQVAANSPDISNPSTISDGDYYIAVTANPSVPETAPSNIPGIGGLTVNNGDMVIWDATASVFELVRGGPLTVAEADALFVSKTGDTMSGGLTTTGLTVSGPGVHGVTYAGAGGIGADIAFVAMDGAMAFFQNGVGVDYLVGRSGATMTGVLILAGDATQALGATTLRQVNSIAGNYLPLSGGVLSGGLSFGSQDASSVTDLTRHIMLYGNNLGIGASNNFMNFVTPSTFRFYASGYLMYVINPNGFTLGDASNRFIQFNLETTSTATFFFRQGGSNRWALAKTADAETGGNAGTLFQLRRHGDNGAVINPPVFTASRVDGLITVAGDPTAALGIATKQYVDAHSGGGGGDYLPIGGGTILGNLAVDGTLAVGSNGSVTGSLSVDGLAFLNSDINCGGTGIAYVGLGWFNRLAFGWDPGAGMANFAVDGTYIDALATFGWVVGNFLQLGGGTLSGNLTANAITSNGGITASGNVNCIELHSRNAFAFTNAGWDGSYLAVGAYWDACWLFTVDAAANLGIIQSNTGIKFGLAGDGSFTGPGNLIVGGAVYVASGQTSGTFYLGLSGLGRILNFSANWYLEWENADGSLNYNSPSGILWGYNNTVGVFINNAGGFSGNGPYSDFSSSRSMKRNITAATYGLPEILRLEPVSFSRVPIEGIRDAPPQIGFIADDLRSIMPEAAIESTWEREPRLGLRTEPILAAAVNAIKELDARLRALEGGRYVQ